MSTAAPLRKIGTWGAVFLAFNGMIGAGIFGLPGKLDAAVGAFAPWLILLAGGGVMLVALCYADLASRFDQSGGPQLYVGEAFGPFLGFHAGWMSYASRVAATAANATVMGAYASAIWPLPPLPVALGAIAAVTAINLFDLKRVMAVLGGLSLLKLLPLLLLVAVGFGSVRPEIVWPVPSAAEGVALAALYAFVGFESATVPAGETRDPKRALPTALLATLAGVTLLYFLIQLAYHAADLPPSDQPLALLADYHFGTAGATLLGATAIVSVFANTSSATTSMARLTAAMAEQRQLPMIFAARIANGAPAVSTLVYGGIAAVLALTGSFVFLAVVSSLARMFAYAACALAVPALDRRAGVNRVFRGWVIPSAAFLLCVWAASQSSRNEWAIFGGFALAGSLLFLLARRSGTDR